MSCGNNCEGCKCGDIPEVLTEAQASSVQAMINMQDALEKIVIACTEEHWSKHDIKRIALAGLGK